MSQTTKIEWADSTINFWSVCNPVSPGCANCYAAALSKRRGWGDYRRGVPRHKFKNAVKSALALNRKPWICDGCGHAHGHRLPTHEKQIQCAGCKSTTAHFHRRRTFSLSLGDIWDEEVPIQMLAEALQNIWQCQDMTWILCSKRWDNFMERIARSINYITTTPCTGESFAFINWMQGWVSGNRIPPNIIGLCSVENQHMADWRMDFFLKVPLAVHGLSMEPLLENIQLDPHWLGAGGRSGENYQQPQIKWLIIGGESGPGARPCNVQWIRSIVEQGRAAGVAVFVKQLGAKPEGAKWPVCERDMGNFGRCDWSTMRNKKGGDPAEWPADLRVQEWPKGF